MKAWNYCTVWTVTSTSLLSRCLVFPASLYAAESQKKQGSICTRLYAGFHFLVRRRAAYMRGKNVNNRQIRHGSIVRLKINLQISSHFKARVKRRCSVGCVWGDTYWEYSTVLPPVSTRRHSACFPPNDVALVQRRPRSVCLLRSVPGPAGWSSRSLWPTSGFYQPTSDLGATFRKAAQFLIVHFYIIQGWNLSFS